MPSSSQRRPRGATAEPPVSTRDATPAPPSVSALGMLLRFISCGLVSIAAALTWKLTLAPAQVGPRSALAGLLFLLSGFIVGGIGWYIRDVRLRLRAPERIDDERLVFSFIVFAVVPFAVLVLVGLVWLLALAVGTS